MRFRLVGLMEKLLSLLDNDFSPHLTVSLITTLKSFSLLKGHGHSELVELWQVGLWRFC